MAEAAAATEATVSLGKGAWDCDNNCEIPPEKEVCSVTAVALTALTPHTQHSATRHTACLALAHTKNHNENVSA